MSLRGSIIEDIVFRALLVLDSLCRLVPRKAGTLALVMRPDAVGDHFLWLRTGAADVSRHARTQAGRVVLLASPAVAAFARETGLWDEVLELDELQFGLNPFYRMRMIGRIRRLGAGLLIQPRASRALWLEDAIARTCGIPHRIGSTGTTLRATASQLQRGDRYYVQLISIDGRLQTHEGIRNIEFAQGLTGVRPTGFRFDRSQILGPVNHVLITLGAGARGRVWPIDKLATLVRHIASVHPSFRIVVAGTRADATTAEQLKVLSGVEFESRVARTSLRQFVELVATSRVVVCNESAAYHIAMAYERDVVCLLGGGHFGIFVPYPTGFFSDDPLRRNQAEEVFVPMDCFGCNWRCIYPRSESGAYRCVDEIPVATAIAATDMLLANRG